MFRRIAWRALGLAGVALALTGAASAAQARALSVEVWTDRGDDAVYQPGDAMEVKVRTNDDAYMLVYEIDSQGQITVLYPWRRAAGMVEGRRTYRLPPEDSNYELAVENATGEGFIVAIASSRPFRDLPWYLRPADPQGESNGYENSSGDEEGFDKDGHVVGDPMVAMERIRRRVLAQPNETDAFATSYTQYYVGHEVRYPRYLCADCHSPSTWAWWDGFDPYYTSCPVFDFRVNWGWAWGPTCWTGYTPYYFYVVRANCPPRFRHWYDDHSRWSSWDGRHRWNDLWGGPLTRYKTPPPTGYVSPGVRAPGPGYTPPGYIAGVAQRQGGRAYLPVGRAGRPGDVNTDPNRGSIWRPPVSSMPPGRPMPGTRTPVTPSPGVRSGYPSSGGSQHWREISRPMPSGGGGRSSPPPARHDGGNSGGASKPSRGSEGHASGGHERGGH